MRSKAIGRYMINKDILREYFDYNPDTGIMTWIKNPPRGQKVAGNSFGNYSNGYLIGMFKRKMYRVHRLAWMWMTGEWPPGDIDHINGIRDDNRWVNFRIADDVQNQQNAKMPKSNTSGVKGVHWHKRDCKWVVNLKIKGKNYCFGAFKDFEFAALVAEEAREKYHGTFARH
jgi:hypothetical protein